MTPGRAGETQHMLVTEPADYLTKLREHLYYVPAFFDPYAGLTRIYSIIIISCKIVS